MSFLNQGEHLFIAHIDEGNAAYLNGNTKSQEESASLMAQWPFLLYELWHRHLAHHSYDVIAKMICDNMGIGLSTKPVSKPTTVCKPCLARKMSAKPCPSSTNRALHPLELVHSDLHGPFRTQTHLGCKYWIMFIDDCTQFRNVYFLKSKDQPLTAFKTYKACSENHWGLKIKALYDDKGGEYMSNQFQMLTNESGIIRLHLVRNMPQQNRIMLEHTTAMLYAASLPPSFLGEAIDLYVTI